MRTSTDVAARQVAYGVRFERGERGAITLAERRTPAVAVLIVVDVLSFSTAVDVANARGAVVMPSRFRSHAESAELAKLYGAELAVPRDQWSHASPYTLSPQSLDGLESGTRLVLPSPNGARCVRAAHERGIPTVIAGCLRNASAVAAYAARHAGSDAIAVIAAGERWADGTLRPALEDDLGAGAIVAALHLRGSASPEARAVAALFRASKATLGDDVRTSVSGRELIEESYPADVERAVEVDVSAIVPVLRPDGFFAAAR